MLVLSRKVGEEIVIGDDVRIKVLSISGNKVRLGITAPGDMDIVRAELEVEIAPDPNDGNTSSDQDNGSDAADAA